MRRILIAVVIAAAAVIAAGWTYQNTYRAEYQVLRAESDEDASTVTLASAGDYANKPAAAIRIAPGPAGDGHGSEIELIFCGGDAANDTFSWRIYAWRRGNGPAAYVASGTGVLGTQAVVKYVDTASAATSKFWADTLAITGGQHWLTAVEVKDSGNNRVAKLVFDFFGYDWLYCEITSADGTTGIEAGDIAVYYSVVN